MAEKTTDERIVIKEGKLRKGGTNSEPDPSTRPGPPVPHPPRKGCSRCPFALDYPPATR
jgi:hypothetical protein